MPPRYLPALLLSLVAACGPTPRPAAAPEEPAPPAPAPAYSNDLERADRLAREAEAIEPPPSPKFSDKAASLAFIKERIRPWIEQRRDAVERADEAYASVVPQLPDLEVAKVALAQGNLKLSFLEDFVSVTVAAAPPNIAADAESMTAYRGAVIDAATVQLEEARSAFERCITLAEKVGGSETASLCRARLAQLPSAAKPADTPRRKEPRKTVEVQPRPFVATRQIKPCVFAGTLKLWEAPLALVPGESPVAKFDQIEIAALELPVTASDPLRVSTVWPVRGTFLLNQAMLPFDVKSKVDLVPGHFWLSPGAAVRAAAKARGKATVSRPESEDVKLRSTPAPVKVVPCSELELAGSRTTPIGALDGERVQLSGEIPLSATPEAAALGVLRVKEGILVQVLERRSGWMRVTAESTKSGQRFGELIPYDFDAWTNATPVERSGFVGGGVYRPRAPATHVVTTELDLSTAPNEKPFAKLVTGISVLVGETRDGFVELSVPALRPSDSKQWGFWVPEAAFRAGARAL